MAVDPAGWLSEPIAAIRALISESSTFQTWVGADNAEEALASIHIVEAQEDDITRPFALVTFGDGYELTRENSEGLAFGRGQIGILFEAVADGDAETAADALYTFTNAVGAILTEMQEGIAAASMPVARGFRIAYGPARADGVEKRNVGDIFQLFIEADWGIGG